MASWGWLRRTRTRVLLGGAAGATAGAAYAHFVGCSTGTCPLTSSVWRAATYGLVVGVLAAWPPRAAPARPDPSSQPR